MADKTMRSITCDSCDKELIVDSSYPHDWGIEVAPKDFGTNSSGMVYACICHPPIDRKHHFCGLKCLAQWAEKQVVPSA